MSLCFSATGRDNCFALLRHDGHETDFAKHKIMAQPIVVNLPHQLGKAEAKRRIQEGFGAMQQLEGGGLPAGLSFEKRWEGDLFHLNARGLGQTMSAVLEILDDSVKVSIDVPNLLTAFAEFIKGAVTKVAVKALGHSK